jgi:hypothetical protein
MNLSTIDSAQHVAPRPSDNLIDRRRRCLIGLGKANSPELGNPEPSFPWILAPTGARKTEKAVNPAFSPQAFLSLLLVLSFPAMSCKACQEKHTKCIYHSRRH